MDYTAIDHYMEYHLFLLCDKQKIHNYIDTENRMRSLRHQFVRGLLTRTELHLITKCGTEEVISRTTLGIQDNFM